MASLSFDASAVAPQTSSDPVPAGTYTVMVTDSDVGPTKNGAGQVAKFTLTIFDGQYAGRKIFARINIRNANAEAERIGQSQLSSLCRAAGVLQLADTAQLHNIAVRAKVKVRKDTTGQYADQNEVVAFEPLAGGAPAAPVANAAPSTSVAPAAAAAAVPPWKRAAA